VGQVESEIKRADYGPGPETTAQTGEAIMKLHTALMAAGVTAVLSITGAFVLPAVASAHSATHTLEFSSYEMPGISFTKTRYGQQDTDRNAAGKTIGYDVMHFTNTSANNATVNIAGDFSGGLLYATFSERLSGKLGAVSHGKVTGGTGAFTGATGTIKVKFVATNVKQVTITYGS
jgi:hypothetical protein